MKVKAIALVASLVASGGAFAQAAAPAPDYTLTGNLTLASDYRFRGVSQTNKKPALQGGFDFAHKSGFYVGNWNSNINSDFYAGSSLEMDFYGGYKGSLGPVNYDVGAIYYYYPGSGDAAGTSEIDNTELYVGASYGPFSAKYFHAVSDYFSLADSKNSYYIDLAATFDLGGGWGVNAHVGYTDTKNYGGDGFDYTDYKVGVTKDLNGFLLGAAYVGTKKDVFADPTSGKDIGKGGLVVSVSKTF